MDYELTEYARDALEKRHIALAWVERAFDAPEATEADPVDPDLSIGWPGLPNGETACCVFIVNGKTTPLRIVTAFFDRRRTIP